MNTADAAIDFLDSIPADVLMASGPYGQVYHQQLELRLLERKLDDLIAHLWNHAAMTSPAGTMQAPDIANNYEVIRKRAEIAEVSARVKSAQQSVGGIVFLPAVENVAKIETKLAALNRKAESLGTSAITLTKTDETLVLNYKPSDEYTRGCDFAHVFVVLAGGTPKIEGFQFLAAITPVDAGNIVKRLPSKTDLDVDLSRFYTTGATCEHCNKIRSRKDCYVVYNESTGDALQVGRSCLRDYTGANNPEAVLKALEQVQELYRSFGQAGTAEVLTTEYFLANCAAKLRTGSETRGLGRAAVHNHFAKQKRLHDKHSGLPLWVDIIDADVELAKTVLAWARNDWTENSEFAHNVKVSLAADYIPERLHGYAGAIFGVRDRALAKAVVEAAKPEAKPVIEGRVKITGTIAKLAWKTNPYRDECTLKLTIVDDRGFTVWGSCPSALEEDALVGARIALTATIKKGDRDESFGFYSRPTNAELLAA